MNTATVGYRSNQSRVRVEIVSGAIVVWLLGCGGKTQTFYRAPEPAPTKSELRLAKAMCSYLQRCDPDGMHLFAGSSPQACEEYFGCFVQSRESWATGLELSEVPDSCVESLSARPCPDAELSPFERFSTQGVFPWGADCGQPSTVDLLAAAPGARHVGEACVDDFGEKEACEERAYCAVDDERPRFGDAYCGTCALRLELGVECEASERCVEGARCVLGHCSRPLEIGEACSDPRQCRFGVCEAGVCERSKYAPEPFAEVLDRACESNDDCGNQDGLFCSDGKCRLRPDEGAQCTDYECRLGLYCVEGRCVALGCSLDLGEACDQGWCHGGDCRSGVCQPMAIQVGAECSSRCGAELECKAGVCVAQPDRSNGASCDFDMNCSSGFCQRDLSAYCSRSGGCSVPSCDKCGTCAPLPTGAMCE